jgi:hypothetical protein
MRKPLKIQARMRHKGTFTRVSNNVERLTSCALIRDGQTIYGKKSHAQLRASLGDEDPYYPNPKDTLGFWTSKDRFVTRDEAKPIGEAAGQCRPQVRELLSSDITW